MLPLNLPSTQSFFYMRIITYAYLNLINDPNTTLVPNCFIQTFYQLLELKNMDKLVLDSMNTSVINYLKRDDNLNKLINFYDQDCKPNNHFNIVTEGHISGSNQEKILDEAVLELTEDDYKQTPLHYFYDGKVISVKDALDYYLLVNYNDNILIS